MAKSTVTTTVGDQELTLQTLSYRDQIELFEQYIDKRRDRLMRDAEKYKLGDEARSNILMRVDEENVFSTGMLRLMLRSPMAIIALACDRAGVDPELFAEKGTDENIDLARRLCGFQFGSKDDSPGKKSPSETS